MRWIVLAAGATAAVLAVLLTLGSTWGPIRELDTELLGRVLRRRFRSDAQQLADQVTHLADLKRGLVLSAAIAGLGLVLRRFRETVAAGVLLLGANMSTQLLQHTHDDSPVVPGSIAVDGPYPSGHITFATSAAAAVVLVVPGALRPLAAACGCGFVAAEALALLIVATHFPSHMVGGVLVTCAWSALVVLGLRELDDRVPRRAAPLSARAGWTRFARAAVATVVVVAAAMAMVATAGGDLERYVSKHGTLAAQAGGALTAFVLALTVAFYLIRWLHRGTRFRSASPETEGGPTR